MSIINNNDSGTLTISLKAFKDIVTVIISRIEGVVPAKNDFINCQYKDNDLKMRINIKVKQGKDIVKTCAALQTQVHESILEMTGVYSYNIDIYIAGFIN